MAVHEELKPDEASLPYLLVQGVSRIGADNSAHTAGVIAVPNDDGTETFLGGGSGVAQWVGDTTPPGRPVGVRATSTLGTALIRWDGELEGGVPADFRCVQIWAQPAGGVKTLVGELRGHGEIATGVYATGVKVDVWAVALDDAHDQWGSPAYNVSAESEHVSVEILPVVSQAELDGKAGQILASASEEAKQQIDKVNTKLEATEQKVDANKTAIDKASENLEGLRQDSETADAEIRESVADVNATISTVNTELNTVRKTADGKNRVITQQAEPSHEGLTVGDVWRQTSDRPLETYWEGEPNNSVSVLVDHSDEVEHTYVWDGTRFTPYYLMLDKLSVSGSVSADLLAANSVTTDKIEANAITAGKLAADSLYGKTVMGGEFITSNKRLVINNAGLMLNDSGGNTTITMLAGDGSATFRDVSIIGGSLDTPTLVSGDMQGGTITGATVTGAIVQTSNADKTGLKMTGGGLVAYDKDKNATFTLSTDGSVLMDGGLSANLEIKAAKISGGEVKGATIVTGDDADNRAVLDSNGLRVVKDGNTLIEFSVNGVDLGTSGIASAKNVSDLSDEVRNTYTPLDEYTATTGVLQNTLTDVQSQVNTQGENLADEIESRRKYMRFAPDTGLEIGAEDSACMMRLTDTRLEFSQGGTVAAYVSNERLNITNAEILSTLRIGAFAFMPRANGHLSLQRIDE